MNDDELRQLPVAPRAVAEKALAESLHGLVAIVEDTGEIMPTRAFESLDVARKVITYLLGLRAAVILENRPNGTASAEEIASVLHLDLQRTRETLSRLKRSIVVKTDEGYEIPLTRVEAARQGSTAHPAKSHPERTRPLLAYGQFVFMNLFQVMPGY